jgi:hypothetical protein
MIRRDSSCSPSSSMTAMCERLRCRSMTTECIGGPPSIRGFTERPWHSAPGTGSLGGPLLHDIKWDVAKLEVNVTIPTTKSQLATLDARYVDSTGVINRLKCDFQLDAGGRAVLKFEGTAVPAGEFARADIINPAAPLTDPFGGQSSPPPRPASDPIRSGSLPRPATCQQVAGRHLRSAGAHGLPC